MMREIGAGMKAGAACAFGRTAPNIVLSTLEKFPEEYEAHMKRRLCQALVCEQLCDLPHPARPVRRLRRMCGRVPEDAIEGEEEDPRHRPGCMREVRQVLRGLQRTAPSGGQGRRRQTAHTEGAALPGLVLGTGAGLEESQEPVRRKGGER